MIVAVLLGVPTGVISAVRQDTTLDYVLRVFSLAGLSMPSFWLGMVIILGLVAWLGWIPPITYVSPGENFRLHAVQFLLPALAVGYRSSALIMRITRSALLEVLREDYIRTAWAKGQSGRVVIWRHALQERDPAGGHGDRHRVRVPDRRSGRHRDGVQPARAWRASWCRRSSGATIPIVQNLVMFIAIVVILSNLPWTCSTAVLDPRVRYGD